MDDKPLLNRLLSGIVIFKLKGKYIQVKPARVEDKAFADFYAQEVYEDALIDGVLTNKDVEQLLLDKGWWSKEEDEKFETLQKNLEQMKLDYYTHFFKEDTRAYIKKSIDTQNKNITKLFEKKQEFFDKTCEYLREFTATAIIVEKNAFFKDGGLASDKIPSNHLVNAFLKESLTEDAIRNIAKGHRWRAVWNCKESTSVFDLNACSLNNEQLSLIGWSRYYDGVYESPDKPNDDIVKDNIALDGWAIQQDRKRKEEEKKAEGEKLLGDGNQDAGEIFVPVKSEREKQNVLALNDAYGKSVLKSKQKQFEKGGSFKENELNHVRREIQMESLRQAKESRG